MVVILIEFWWWINFLVTFTWKINFYSLFYKVKKNNIFQWKVQLLIVFEFLLSWKLEQLLFLIFKKSDLPPANILRDDVISSGQFIITPRRNKRGPKILSLESWATLAVTFFHDEVLPFRTTLWRDVEQFFDNFKRVPSIP